MSENRYTLQQAREYIEQHREAMLEAYRAFEGIPEAIRGPKLEETWCAGCWLNAVLAELGASPEMIEKIGFAHGQRSLFGDPLVWGVAYANHYAETGEPLDQPGDELADEINLDQLGGIGDAIRKKRNGGHRKT